MRFILVVLYIISILVLQTVVFARLNFFGIVPDLLLVSVVLFSIFNVHQKAVIFAAASGLLKDILGFGIYLNVIVKTLTATAVILLKENFLGDEYLFAFVMVAVFTPVSMLAGAGILYFIGQYEVQIGALIFDLASATACNLLFVPLLFPVVKRLSHA